MVPMTLDRHYSPDEIRILRDARETGQDQRTVRVNAYDSSHVPETQVLPKEKKRDGEKKKREKEKDESPSMQYP